MTDTGEPKKPVLTVGDLIAALEKFNAADEIRIKDADTGWHLVVDEVVQHEPDRVLLHADYYSDANFGEKKG